MSLLSQQGQDKSKYLSEDTIAALITSIGGAVSVIRVSGPRAFEVLLLLNKKKSLNDYPDRKLVSVRLYDHLDYLIDDVLVARFGGPHSFTGEDVFEINHHGSPVVANRFLKVLTYYNVRQALPGEFSFRAVRNGKLDLTQAQGLADLIASTHEGAAQLALEKLSGIQRDLIKTIAEELKEITALSEVGIDFSDQDIDEASLKTLKNKLNPIVLKLENLSDTFKRGRLLQDGIRTALIGQPNVGKSSLFNALLGEDRAIVTEIPGTTRDVLRETITLESETTSLTLRLEDTAGLRSAQDQVEKMGIEKSLEAAKNADLVLFLVEIKQNIELAKEVFESLFIKDQKIVGVLTKCDLAHSVKQVEQKRDELQKIFQIPFYSTSAKTGEGISSFALNLAKQMESFISRPKGEILLTRLEQLNAVKDALSHLKRAQLTNEQDLFASDMRQALYSLEPLIGTVVPDDIIDKIFSQFCIGK